MEQLKQLLHTGNDGETVIFLKHRTNDPISYGNVESAAKIQLNVYDCHGSELSSSDKLSCLMLITI